MGEGKGLGSGVVSGARPTPIIPKYLFYLTREAIFVNKPFKLPLILKINRILDIYIHLVVSSITLSRCSNKKNNIAQDFIVFYIIDLSLFQFLRLKFIQPRYLEYTNNFKGISLENRNHDQESIYSSCISF